MDAHEDDGLDEPGADDFDDLMLEMNDDADAPQAERWLETGRLVVPSVAVLARRSETGGDNATTVDSLSMHASKDAASLYSPACTVGRS